MALPKKCLTPAKHHVFGKISLVLQRDLLIAWFEGQKVTGWDSKKVTLKGNR